MIDKSIFNNTWLSRFSQNLPADIHQFINNFDDQQSTYLLYIRQHITVYFCIKSETKPPVCTITSFLHSKLLITKKKGAKLPLDEPSLESDERRKDG